MREGGNRSIKDEISDYWGLRAPGFDLQPGHEIFSDEEREAWVALFHRHLGPGQGRKALDLACGTGVIALVIHALGFEVTALDLTEAMLERAKTKAAARGAAIDFFMGDAEATLERSDSYDALVTRHLIWTLPDPAAAFADWLRVLKPGGRVVAVEVDMGSRRGARRRLLAGLAGVVRRFEKAPPRIEVDAEARERIFGAVHFGRTCRPEEVAALLEAAGFVDIRVDLDLAAIHRAQGRFMPLHVRLERASQDRYLISAAKPGRG